MEARISDRLSPSRLLFDHIPKTAGMTLHALLIEKLGDSKCSPILNGTYASMRAEFDQYRCVSGHIQYEPMANLSDVWAFTLLRSPIDRLISEYYFLRSEVAPQGNPIGERARQRDLAGFVELDEPWVLPSISNVMVAHLSVLKWDGVSDLSPSRQLQCAKDALAEFELVGLTERFPESVDALFARLCLGPPTSIPRVNANARRPVLADVPAATLKRLAGINELDLELYAFAQQIYDRQRRRTWFDTPETHRGIRAEVPTGNSQPPNKSAAPRSPGAFGNGAAEILAVEVHGSIILGATLLAGEIAIVRVIFRAHADLDDIAVGIRIADARGRLVFGTNTWLLGKRLSVKSGDQAHVDFRFAVALGIGDYAVGAALHSSTTRIQDYYHWIGEATRFQVAGNIGWHFEGGVKLNPTVAIGGQVVNLIVSENPMSSMQRLAQHAPALTTFQCRLAAQGPLSNLFPGEVVAFCVAVTNTGDERWWSTGERSVSVSYHWSNEQSEIAIFDGARSPLPHDIEPGQSVSVWVKVEAPHAVGRYRLQLTLVQEFVGWFDEHGSASLEMAVQVRAKQRQPRIATS